MNDYTKKYYEMNADSFIENTLHCDMQRQYLLLEKYVKPTCTIMDLGFGSGRDMLYFQSKGYTVCGIDTSPQFCNHAKEMGLDVQELSVLDLNRKNEVDAIWACASLLHIKSDDLSNALQHCYAALKPDGYMYVSFKYGDFEGERNGRYFTFMTEDAFRTYYEPVGFELVETSISRDVRKERMDKWLNVVLKRG